MSRPVVGQVRGLLKALHDFHAKIDASKKPQAFRLHVRVLADVDRIKRRSLSAGGRAPVAAAGSVVDAKASGGISRENELDGRVIADITYVVGDPELVILIDGSDLDDEE